MKIFTNGFNMSFTLIPSGSFLMGSPIRKDAEEPDFDERPVHRVSITSAFFAGISPVTNAQYEQFDPEHKAMRGKNGFSKEDDEAVLYVSWYDAVRFCGWLSEKEGRHYRLLTEAEWEYSCRAGTSGNYWTGETLPVEYHRHQVQERGVFEVSLKTAQSPANPWGLHDMHGVVEEWCSDWYGPYSEEDQEDPVGPATGESKITRGGSHSTTEDFLRSARRLGALPEDRDWITGFRIAQADEPKGEPAVVSSNPIWSRSVSQSTFDWGNGPDMDKPYFSEPKCFVHIPPDSKGPLYSRHNHCPALTWCPNGDLLAVWFTTNREKGREMAIAASRLRPGSDGLKSSEWEAADLFFKVPARNTSGSSLYNDGNGTLYFFNGIYSTTIHNMFAVIMKKSTDNGKTWSRAEIIQPNYQGRGQVVAGTFATKEGYILVPADAQGDGLAGTVLLISRDGGKTYRDPGDWEKPGGIGALAVVSGLDPAPDFERSVNIPKATIAGFHAGIVQLDDGSLLAFGRRSEIADRIPMSRSDDMGETWRYSASEFPPITSGQRLVLIRLAEGPLLFISFTDATKKPESPEGISITDVSGKKRTIFGMFAALSYDEGRSWPVKRLISNDSEGTSFGDRQWVSDFTMDYAHGERKGYLTAIQTPDGIIHLISSALYYSFNLAWLQRPMPAAAESSS